ncbi:hypothetical protein MPSEU_000262100 [Mayamaea pseudoterrestris]|nr:hypothetical protein MPSEU_000262100 [Mayamaea pseudoterrestris]
MPKLTKPLRSSSRRAAAQSSPYAAAAASTQSTDSWSGYYEKLVDYYNEHGNADVPLHYYLDPSLGAWVQEQRDLHHSTNLSKDRYDALDELEFEWELEEVRYSNKRSPAMKKQKKDSKEQPKTQPEQQTQQRKQQQEQATKTLAAPARSASKAATADASWNRNFAKLQAYHEKHVLYASGQLESEKYNQLDQLGFWSEHALSPPRGTRGNDGDNDGDNEEEDEAVAAAADKTTVNEAPPAAPVNEAPAPAPVNEQAPPVAPVNERAPPADPVNVQAPSADPVNEVAVAAVVPAAMVAEEPPKRCIIM